MPHSNSFIMSNIMFFSSYAEMEAHLKTLNLSEANRMDFTGCSYYWDGRFETIIEKQSDGEYMVERRRCKNNKS